MRACRSTPAILTALGGATKSWPGRVEILSAYLGCGHCFCCGRGHQGTTRNAAPVTDLISPTPPILTGIGTLAWHRGSVRPRLPTPLQSAVYDAEESVWFFVVPQKPTLPPPPEDIMSSRTIYKDWFGIWTRILLLAELFTRLVRALRREGRHANLRHVNLLQRRR